jgi:hypothetical protein
MSGFFQKVKDGAAKAADKAQQALELQRLNSQISTKQKEIEKVKIQIGDAVLAAFKNGSISEADHEITNLSHLIIRYEGMISDLELKIKEVKSGYPFTGGN